MRRILVVEDDPAIRQGVVDALDFHGFRVIEAERGDVGLEKAVQAEIDLVLLDLVLPGMDGLEVLRQLRGARPALPVIVLTARGEESDRVKGLQLGADDYVVKPFGVKELLARVEAVLRRTAERPTDVRTVSFPGGSADLERREIRFDGGERMAEGGRQKGPGDKKTASANRHPPSAIRHLPCRALRARGGTAALPRGQRQSGDLARGTALARLADGRHRAGNPDGGHARRPPPREAPR